MRKEHGMDLSKRAHKPSFVFHTVACKWNLRPHTPQHGGIVSDKNGCRTLASSRKVNHTLVM